jgi:hypothetical protein
MAPASEAGAVLSPRRAGPGNATRVSPARAGRCPVDRQVREGQRPAPGPAGAKRPPLAGRALAGGFGPPAGPDLARRWAKGDGPCQTAGGLRSRVLFSLRRSMPLALFQQPAHVRRRPRPCRTGCPELAGLTGPEFAQPCLRVFVVPKVPLRTGKAGTTLRRRGPGNRRDAFRQASRWPAGLAVLARPCLCPVLPPSPPAAIRQPVRRDGSDG